MFLLEFWWSDSLGVCATYSRNWNEFIKLWDGDTQHYLTEMNFSCSTTMRETHTLRTSVTKIQELGRIKLLSHPAHSSDLASSDYYSYTARTFMAKIQELWGIKLLPHPAYSSNLASFRLLFVSIHGPLLAWKKFRTRNSYRREIINLAEIWPKTIESDGLCFEEWFNFLSEDIPNKIFVKKHYLWDCIYM